MADIHIPTVDSVLKRAIRSVPENVRLAFVSSFACGLAMHFFALTNKLVNRDEIPGLFASHDRTVIGRYLLSELRDLFTNYSLPWVNGFVTILSFAAVASLVVAILRIRKPLHAVLTGAALLAFPTVGNFLSYMHTADANAVGLLIGVVGAYLLDRKKWGFLPAAILFSLSIGTYQANICFIGALMATRGLAIVLEGEHTDREVLIIIAKYVAAFARGALIYSRMNDLVLYWKGQQLTSYMGISDARIEGPAELIKLAVKGSQRYFRFLTRDSRNMTNGAMPLIHLVLVGLSAALFLFALAQKKRRSVMQWVLSVLVFLLLPLAYDSIYLFKPELVHILMLHSAAFTYILPLMLLDGLAEPEKPVIKSFFAAATWAGVGAVLLSVWFWGLYTNQGYLLLKLKYENISALLNRVVDSVEQSPEYVPNMPVAFIGDVTNGEYPAEKADYLDAFYTGVGFGNESDYGFINDDKHVRHFIRYYIGVDFANVDDDTLNALESSEAARSMPCYPKAGSMQMMDGVLVVKLGE